MVNPSLPTIWASTKFTEVLDIQGGTQPPKSQFIDAPKEGYIRLLQIRDFGKKPVPTYIPDTHKLKKCEKTDVLIGRYGASLGRICTGMEGAYNVALAKVLAPANIEPDFLRRYLESEVFQAPLRLLSRSAQNGFNKGDLDTFDFLLPPVAEQKVIADKLDTLLAQVENTKVRLQRIPQILKRFRQSVLSAAARGDLSKGWRRLNNDRKTSKQLRVEELAKSEKYSLGIGPFGSNLKVSDYRSTGHPLIFVRDIRSSVFGSENTKYVSTEKFQELKAHRALPGDILITKMGDPPGDVCIYPNSRPEAVITADCIKLSVDESIANTKYVMYAMQSDQFRALVLDISAGVAQQKVNLKKFRKLEIPVPSKKEQTEIVRRVEQLFAYADTIEQQVNNALARVEKLTQSILAKAFRGELTAEWRAQNPELISGDNRAQALLEKIRVERAAAKPSQRKKSRARA